MGCIYKNMLLLIPTPLNSGNEITITGTYDDVIKWKHFRRYWPFVRGIHLWSVNSPHKGQWRGALAFSLICVWINGWVNNGKVGDLRPHRTHYGATVMISLFHVVVNYLSLPYLSSSLADNCYCGGSGGCHWIHVTHDLAQPQVTYRPPK